MYYSAAWTDSGFLLGCSHAHETIVEADSCIPCAGSRTIARAAGESYQRNTIADASLFRTPLLSTSNDLQAAGDCLSTSKYVKNGNTTGEDNR